VAVEALLAGELRAGWRAGAASERRA
jgi:hypothetical protein